MSRLRNERGSLLLMSYMVIAMLLGVAIPQSMRALHYSRLVQLNVDDDRAFHAADAALDYVLSAILTTHGAVRKPSFGRPGHGAGDADWVGDPLNGGVNLGGVDACAQAGYANWDCWPATLRFAGPTPQTSFSVSIRAQDIGPSSSELSIPVTKRLRLYVMRGNMATPFEGSIVHTQEAIVQVERLGSVSGLRVGHRLRVNEGNGEEDNLIKAQRIIGYGDVTGSGSNWYDYVPVAIGGSQAMWGQVVVKETPGMGPLCCDPNSNPPYHIRLGGSGIGARLREYSDRDRYDFMLPDGTVDLPAYQAYVASLERVASKQNNVEGLSDQRPRFLDAATENEAFVYDKVAPKIMAESSCLNQTISGPGGNGRRTITFCVDPATLDPGDPNYSQYFQGACGQADTTSGEHHVYHIGQAAPDGSGVEYCIGSMNLGQGVEVRFQGVGNDNPIQVYAAGYNTHSGAVRAFAAGANSNILGFDRSESAQILPAAGYLDAQANIYDFLRSMRDDPNKLGALSLNVLESNKWLEPTANNYVKDQADYEIDEHPVGIVPKVDLNGDYFFGTVNAPRSEVNLSYRYMMTRLAGLRSQDLLGRIVSFTGSQGWGTLLILSAEEQGRGMMTAPAELIAWRRCRVPDCSS